MENREVAVTSRDRSTWRDVTASVRGYSWIPIIKILRCSHDPFQLANRVRETGVIRTQRTSLKITVFRSGVRIEGVCFIEG